VKLQEYKMTDSPHSAHWRKKRFRQCAPELSSLVAVVAMALYPCVSHCQTPAALPPVTVVPATAATGTPVSAPIPALPAQTNGTPITLDEAIRRAQISDVSYRTAAANKSVAGLDKSIARSALLPGVVYHNQYIYTKPGQQASTNTEITGTTSTPIFIASNSVHEYISQGVVTETIGVAKIADYHRLSAEAEASAARQEVARRGLVATVISNYFGVLAAERKLVVAQHAADEAQRFSQLTMKLEAGREVAHADVVKANLQLQQRQRDLADAGLAAEKARLDLAVLLFPDPFTPYTLTNDLDQPFVLPGKAEVQADAAKNNPDVRAALQAARAAKYEVTASKAAYLPDLSLGYIYGIDAPQLALKGPDDTHNLGYSAFATLDIPVWDWFATRSRVRQSVIRSDLAHVELTMTQRQLIASIETLYNEAAVAIQQLASFDESVRTAADSLRLTNMRYSAGEATVLEVVDAQNSYTLAEAADVDAAVRYHVAFGQLQTLTGKLQ
jgi:outer membrane protein TolC